MPRISWVKLTWNSEKNDESAGAFLNINLHQIFPYFSIFNFFTQKTLEFLFFFCQTVEEKFTLTSNLLLYPLTQHSIHSFCNCLPCLSLKNESFRLRSENFLFWISKRLKREERNIAILECDVNIFLLYQKNKELSKGLTSTKYFQFFGFLRLVSSCLADRNILWFLEFWIVIYLHD